MMNKEMVKDMQKISDEIKGIDEEIKKERSPFIYIISVFLTLIIIVMIVPYYSIRLDPEPKIIPDINEIVPKKIDIIEEAPEFRSHNDLLLFINPSDPIVKRTADKLISLACDENRICYAKAIFYFVRDRFDYVNDPTSFEYVKSARESLITSNGDCDDASVLLANLLQSIGVRTRFVFVPSHVYVQAYMPDVLKRYQDEGWVNLDPTCQSCEFGEISFRYKDANKEYVGG